LSAFGARLAATAEPSSVIGALLAAAAATPEPDDHRPFWMVGRFRSSRRDNSRHAHKRNTFFVAFVIIIIIFFFFSVMLELHIPTWRKCFECKQKLACHQQSPCTQT
jgi:hypothetical protein